jgi:hypothetical protein
MGTNFTDLAITEMLVAATLNDRLDELDAAVPTGDAADEVVTAGEAIAAREVVFVSTGSGGRTAGRAYLGNATATATSSEAFALGVATASISSGASGSVRLAGIVDGFSGLTAGAVYYLSATAGAITATPPANVVMVGIALSSTQLLLNSRGAQPGSISRVGYGTGLIGPATYSDGTFINTIV